MRRSSLITRVQQDIASARQDRPRSSAPPQGAQGSQKWPAGDTRRPFHLRENGSSTPSWLAPSSPSEVRLGSDRGFASSPDAYGVDLRPTSEVSLAQRIWAQLSLDSGYVWPDAVGGEAPANPISPVPSASASTHGMKIHSMSTTTSFAQPDEDWMGWLPYFHYRPVGADLRSEITWNAQASPYAVDIKAQRKLEELNQTL